MSDSDGRSSEQIDLDTFASGGAWLWNRDGFAVAAGRGRAPGVCAAAVEAKADTDGVQPVQPCANRQSSAASVWHGSVHDFILVQNHDPSRLPDLPFET